MTGQFALMFQAAWMLVALPGKPENEVERFQLAEEMSTWSRIGLSPRVSASTSLGSALVFLAWGRHDLAEEQWEITEEAYGSRDRTAQLYHLFAQITKFTLEGQLTEAAATLEALKQAGEDAGTPEVGYLYCLLVGMKAELDLGHFEEAGEINSRGWRAFGGKIVSEASPPFEALILASSGKVAEARQVLAHFQSENPGLAGGENEWGLRADSTASMRHSFGGQGKC